MPDDGVGPQLLRGKRPGWRCRPCPTRGRRRRWPPRCGLASGRLRRPRPAAEGQAERGRRAAAAPGAGGSSRRCLRPSCSWRISARRSRRKTASVSALAARSRASANCWPASCRWPSWASRRSQASRGTSMAFPSGLGPAARAASGPGAALAGGHRGGGHHPLAALRAAAHDGVDLAGATPGAQRGDGYPVAPGSLLQADAAPGRRAGPRRGGGRPRARRPPGSAGGRGGAAQPAARPFPRWRWGRLPRRGSDGSGSGPA